LERRGAELMEKRNRRRDVGIIVEANAMVVLKDQFSVQGAGSEQGQGCVCIMYV
jgi:hypothetical protein